MNLEQAMKKMTEGNPELAKMVQEKYEATEIVRTLIGLRAKAGVSEKELADRLGYKPGYVTRIELGIDEDLCIADIYAYCHALDMKVKLKLEVEEDAPHQK